MQYDKVSRDALYMLYENVRNVSIYLFNLQFSYAYIFLFLQRAPIDEGMKQEVVIDRNIVTADGLAIDWVYSHLYWTDTGTNTISMSDLDGNLITKIIKDDLEEPRAIALHPAKG
jgi:hypothetical protein